MSGAALATVLEVMTGASVERAMAPGAAYPLPCNESRGPDCNAGAEVEAVGVVLEEPSASAIALAVSVEGAGSALALDMVFVVAAEVAEMMLSPAFCRRRSWKRRLFGPCLSCSVSDLIDEITGAATGVGLGAACRAALLRAAGAASCTSSRRRDRNNVSSSSTIKN